MASAHFEAIGAADANTRAGTAQPLVAGIVTVLLVGAGVFAAHGLVAGQAMAQLWPVGAVLAAVAVLTTLGLMIVKGVGRRASWHEDGAVLPARAGARRVRRHRRFVPKQTMTTLTTFDGCSIAARIVDVSMGGVSVEARIDDLEFANVTWVGSRPAGPVRRTGTGAVFTFMTLLDPVIINDELVL